MTIHYNVQCETVKIKINVRPNILNILNILDILKIYKTSTLFCSKLVTIYFVHLLYTCDNLYVFVYNLTHFRDNLL